MENAEKIFAIDIRLLEKKRTGDEAVFFNLTKELLKLDRKNQYLLLTDETDDEKRALLSRRLECEGQTNVEVVCLPAKNRFVWNFWALPTYLRKKKIDVFHTQYILPIFVPRRTSVVLHIHDVSFRAYPELIGLSDRFFLWLLIPRSLRRANAIVTPSCFTRDEIIRYYGTDQEKITVIENALSDDFLIPDETHLDRISAVKNKYRLPEKYVLYVGTLQPRKNIPFLIEAFVLLRKRLPQTKLVVVGNRDAHHTDQRLSDTLSRTKSDGEVIFPGFIDQQDLPTVVRGAEVFVFPSLYEGFGIPLLEAMSQKVPVAAADIPSLREIAREAAVFFDPTSIASCEETLYTLSVDQQKREALIRLGDGRVSVFSWHKSAEKLLVLYNKLS